ncbi:head-to-tail stopper [Arthrobacter phage KeAlii]|uniref:Head-to-tail stopper n=1 Tax=Arthrobacter phage KeAlii TaxID=2885973 RepID=A0AA95B8L6_9CAUD|nr:head closure Hc1 [Arthrobacter phage KeAlii]UDL14616.1 head-to-tail stopper [Arthrobacter phage KeAlii]
MLLTAYKKTPSVYRLRAGTTTDSYGDPVESWDNPQRTLLRGATVQNEKTTEEDGQARRVIRSEFVLFAPGAVDLTSDDRIEAEGRIWRVDGDPVVRRGLASTVYTTASLERVTIG